MIHTINAYCYTRKRITTLTTCASVPITINIVSLNPAHGEVYTIHYMIKFVGDLRQAGGFLRVLWFPPLIKLTATI